MKTWILIILEIIKAIFGRKEPDEKAKIKKRIKELNREIEKYKKLCIKARKNNHIEQLLTFSAELRKLTTERADLEKILSQ